MTQDDDTEPALGQAPIDSCSQTVAQRDFVLGIPQTLTPSNDPFRKGRNERLPIFASVRQKEIAHFNVRSERRAISRAG
jgi:hypothetical protein